MEPVGSIRTAAGRDNTWQPKYSQRSFRGFGPRESLGRIVRQLLRSCKRSDGWQEKGEELEHCQDVRAGRCHHGRARPGIRYLQNDNLARICCSCILIIMIATGRFENCSLKSLPSRQNRFISLHLVYQLSSSFNFRRHLKIGSPAFKIKNVPLLHFSRKTREKDRASESSHSKWCEHGNTNSWGSSRSELRLREASESRFARGAGPAPSS